MGVERVLADERDSADVLFPGVDPAEGALRIASEALIAQALSGDRRVHKVGLDASGQFWRQVAENDGRPAPPDGDYEWRAERQSG